MPPIAYEQRREQIEHYFDRTAAQAWARLTSQEPLGHIRSSVREGRNRMRDTLLSWLPQDMHGLRLLDAGCGTGALAIEAAERGAEVVAIDLSPTLVQLAAERLAEQSPDLAQRIRFCSGDMLDESLGTFDHVVAMDSLIHYPCEQIAQALGRLAPRTRGSMLFTFAPRTPLLAAMHRVGRMFPRSDRSPALEPIAASRLHLALHTELGTTGWHAGRDRRIAHGFYTSHALEWRR
ncbi:MAG: Magnesium-protoporphyrin O-methyltransferase [Pseudomonadota bacterium]|jgi:magnesium-protoporphyrin O-methyltransferase